MSNDFSPASSKFTDAGEGLYSDSDSEGGADSFSDAGASYDQAGSDYESDAESYDSEDGADSTEQISAPMPVQKRPEVASVSTDIQARTASALELLSIELSLMRKPSTVVKLTQDQIDSGIQHRKVKFYMEDSLENCAARGVEPRIELRGDPVALFGAKNITISSIDFESVDNRFPVSLAIDAPHLPGEKICAQPTVTGESVMCDAPRARSIEYGANPLRVYKSTENPFSLDFSSKYPLYNKDNLWDDIDQCRDGVGEDGSAEEVSLVPRKSPVMSTILLAREKAGDSIDEKLYVAQIDKYLVSNKEICRAINSLREMLVKSTESTAVKDVFFVPRRSVLTAETIKTRSSVGVSEWKDSAEIGHSLKGNMDVFKNEFKKTKSITITATIAFRPLADQAVSKK